MKHWTVTTQQIIHSLYKFIKFLSITTLKLVNKTLLPHDHSVQLIIHTHTHYCIKCEQCYDISNNLTVLIYTIIESLDLN